MDSQQVSAAGVLSLAALAWHKQSAPPPLELTSQDLLEDEGRKPMEEESQPEVVESAAEGGRGVLAGEGKAEAKAGGRSWCRPTVCIYDLDDPAAFACASKACLFCSMSDSTHSPRAKSLP